MGMALELARKGQGYVEPNPMVGCVIVRSGRLVGQGYHEKFGGPHAEPNALRAADRRARGATAYVTLEPCGHFGKTPPCTAALIQAGVRRVVAAMKDPNPQVAGKGLRLLRAAGIAVEVGLLDDEAAALNAPFITFHTKKRPYVILKWAQSIDGKIATRTGDSKWITSLESRTAAHALRARVDAIIVGVGTILADDPGLTARLAPPKRSAARIMLDPNLRIPLGARLVRTARRTPTMIVTGKGASPRKSRRLAASGCQVFQVTTDKNGILLLPFLHSLRDQGMTNILVEGGGRTLGAFLEAGLADEAWIFVAPKLIGGETAPGPLRNLGPASMRELPAISRPLIRMFGPDVGYNVGFTDPNRP